MSGFLLLINCGKNHTLVMGVKAGNPCLYRFIEYCCYTKNA
jgi:hypothetical protein